MTIHIDYFKRFRMEMELSELPSVPDLPPQHYWVPYDEGLVDTHALVQFQCFSDEMDSHVFPCLGDRNGSRLLMHEICRKPGFLPAATWLIVGPDGYCGTVQGVRERGSYGAIQNLGVVPQQRGLGFGRALLLQALHGFRYHCLPRAHLEVTAENDVAVRLYQHVGFRRMKTVYKAVPT